MAEAGEKVEAHVEPVLKEGPLEQVLRVAAEPHGVCHLEAPLSLDLHLRGARRGVWSLRFVADVVHHQLPVELDLEEHWEEKEEGAKVELKTGELQLVKQLPESALESLGVLEARLMHEGEELALVRLVTDVRWSGKEWQRGILDPFR